MFHDLGLTARYATSTERFEIDGADAARDFLVEHGVDTIRGRHGVAGHRLTHNAGGFRPASTPKSVCLSPVSPRTSSVPVEMTLTADVVDAVTAAHPRPDFKNRILVAFNDGMKHRPETTFGTMNADVLRHFDPNFAPRNMVDAIYNSPWPE